MRKMFSENQIKGMIESGVQSGATALYQHTLNIKDSDDNTKEFYIFHYRKEEITSENFDDMLATSLCIQDANNYQCLYDYDASEFYAFASGSFTSAGAISSIVSDDITKL